VTLPEEPQIVDLVDQPYAAIRAQVTMSTIPEIADRFPELLAHLAERGIEPVGPPFLKYDVFGPGDALEIEAGVPVADVSEGAGPVAFAILRAGRYATVSHHGSPAELGQVTADLLEWAAGRDLEWDMDEDDGVETWGARMEVYNTDPREEPDWSNWENDLLFRLAN
jgi:effector-binding domain-containing protein